MFNNFSFEIRAVYEIMWRNTVESDRPQTTIWFMHTACWIHKATDIKSVYVTYCFSTAKVIARTRLGVTLHVNCLSCFRYTKM
jgi:hypothetical protein